MLFDLYDLVKIGNQVDFAKESAAVDPAATEIYNQILMISLESMENQCAEGKDLASDLLEQTSSVVHHSVCVGGYNKMQ